MTRALALAMLVFGCGALSAQSIVVQMPDEVGFGAAFELVVTAPQQVDVAALAPLQIEVVRTEPAGEQVRTFCRARCYEVGEVALAGVDRTLQVRSSLADPDSELEWPNDGYELQGPGGASALWLGLLAVAALSLVTWWRWLRARRRVPLESAATAAPSWSALAALDALALPADHAGHARYFRELKQIVRRQFRDRMAVPAEFRTSEELLRAAPLPAAARDAVRPCLDACDAELFGGGVVPVGAPDAARSSARRFVQLTEEAS